MNTKRPCPNNILAARETLQLSQKEVAISLSVTPPAVSDWERCLKYPTVDNLKQLCSLFQMSSDYLLGLTNRTSLANTASPDWNGDLIRELRRDRDESIDQVALSLGIAPYLYQQYENCEAEPCLSDLIAISEHFGVSYDELLRRVFSKVGANGKVVTSDFRVSPKEQALVEGYRSATDKERITIDTILSDYQKKVLSSDKAM